MRVFSEPKYLCVTHLALEKLKSKRKIERDSSEERGGVKMSKERDESSTESESGEEKLETKPTSIYDYLRDPKTRDLLDSSDSLDEIMLNMMDTYQKTGEMDNSESGSSLDCANSVSKNRHSSSTIRLDYDHHLKYFAILLILYFRPSINNVNK